MARKRKKKDGEQEVPSLPLTPMIDCTFLLLIFFMLACRFRSEEGKLQAHLPKDRGQGTGTPTIDLQQVRLKLLWYSPDGQPRYTRPDGRLIVKIGRHSAATVFDWVQDIEGNSQPDWDAVRDYVTRKKNEYRPPPDDPTKILPVIIDSRKYVPFYWIVRSLDTLVAAGIKDITFAAPEIPY
ncbi:MAG: ExbD/TolR family protein [Planctomycetota bacterium]|jgi:biopolymer transport protein ExbD